MTGLIMDIMGKIRINRNILLQLFWEAKEMKKKLLCLCVLIPVLMFGVVSMAAEELIGEWTLTASETGTYPDSTVYGNEAIIYGASYDAGEGAFFFDGNAADGDGPDYLDIENATYPFDFTENFRINLDLKVPDPSGAFPFPFFSRRAGDGWAAGDWFFGVNSGGVIEGNGHSVGGYGPGTKLVYDGPWHNVDLSYEAATDTLTCTVDNAPTADFTASPFKGATPDNSGHIWIGNHSNYLYFKGYLKNIQVYRIWEKAFGSDPVLNSFGNPTGLQTLSWQSPFPEYQYFNVYLGTDDALVAARDAGTLVNVEPLNATQVDETLAGETTYYWAVDCLSDPNETTGEYTVLAPGDLWQFDTLSNYPVNLAPADGAAGLSIFTDITFNVDSAADSYNVYLADSNQDVDTVSPISFATGDLAITVDTPTLELNRTYEYKVGAVRGGMEYVSAVKSFQTAGIEFLETFDEYANDAEVRAAWVEPIWQGFNDLTVGPEYSRYGMEIPFHTSTDVSYTRNFDEVLDFNDTRAIAIEIYYKGGSDDPDSLIFKLLDSSESTILEKTITTADFIVDEGSPVAGQWYWVYMSLDGVNNIDQVKKMSLSVPSQTQAGTVKVDNISLRVPYCPPAGIPGDFYNDCQIDMMDVASIGLQWFECDRIPQETCFSY